MKMNNSSNKMGGCLSLIAQSALAGLMLCGCSNTSHRTVPADLGKPVSSDSMESLLDQPGPIEFKTIVGADWRVSLAGLVNLDNPAAKAAGLNDRDEAIQVYTYFLRHPSRGLFIVDTGVSKKLAEAPSSAGVGWMVGKLMHLGGMRLRQGTLEALQSEGTPLKGVLMTHLHVDHISGMPDIADFIPVYVGPLEAKDTDWKNLIVQGTTDRLLAGRPPLEELQFVPDSSGKFEGVLDLFGDGSVFAISSPGHTAGSVAYVVRTTKGPVLLTGDTCHTKWGWENGVEPGSFTKDQGENRKNLLALKALALRHPTMIVRLGHQP